MRPRRITRAGRPILGALVVAMAACGDGGTEASGPLGVGPSELQLPPCRTQQIPLSGAKNDAVQWSSSIPDVASVSNAGLVTARRPGQTVVSARLRADTAQVASVTVSVPEGSPSLVVEGAAADTIDARVAHPISAVYHYAQGCAAADVLVRFSSPSVVVDSYTPPVPAIRLGSAGTEPASAIVEVRTDSMGRAAASMVMGPQAGVFQVHVAPRGVSLVDSVAVTVRPGALQPIRVAPRDTAVFVGASYRLRVIATDRRGNPRPDAVTYAAADPTASADGGLIRGTEFGRTAVVVRAGTFSDTARVSIVPQGVLAGYQFTRHSGDTVALVMVHLDGSLQRRLAVAPLPIGYNGHMASDWDPNGSRVVYSGGGFDRDLFTVDTLGGAPRRFITTSTPSSADLPQFSADGRYVFFVQGSGWELWRARSDGSGAERIPPFAGGHFGVSVENHPSPSPDGTRVVATQGDGITFRLRTFDLAGAPGQVTATPGVHGFGPRWSPAGDWIAYVAPDGRTALDLGRYDYAQGALRLVRPDGSGDRPLGAGRYSLGIDWSPDGRYVVARSERGLLEVIDTQTGVVVQLPFSARIAAPSWRP